MFRHFKLDSMKQELSVRQWTALAKDKEANRQKARNVTDNSAWSCGQRTKGPWVTVRHSLKEYLVCSLVAAFSFLPQNFGRFQGPMNGKLSF